MSQKEMGDQILEIEGKVTLSGSATRLLQSLEVMSYRVGDDVDLALANSLDEESYKAAVKELLAHGLVQELPDGPGLEITLSGLAYLTDLRLGSPEDIKPEPRLLPNAKYPELVKSIAEFLYSGLHELDVSEAESTLSLSLQEFYRLDSARRGRPEERDELMWQQAPEQDFSPPRLESSSQRFEGELALKASGRNRNIAWYDRTVLFSDLWDQYRRRKLGVLGSFFRSWRPRWELPEWDDFNQGRQEADLVGAEYGPWIEAQFDRMLAEGKTAGPKPADLHGADARRCYLTQAGLPEDCGLATSDEPPYDISDFNPDDPGHAAYANGLMDRMEQMAGQIYGKDLRGPVYLVAQAIKSGRLPKKALDLRPDWKAAVEDELNPPATAASPKGVDIVKTGGAAKSEKSTKPAKPGPIRPGRGAGIII